MENPMNDYKNKGRTAETSRIERHAEMVEHRKEKRKEYMAYLRNKTEEEIQTFTLEGKKYIYSFPRSYFPIPTGAGHECKNCQAYASIGDILFGLCRNCCYYIYMRYSNAEFTELRLPLIIPSYITEKEKTFIYNNYTTDPIINDSMLKLMKDKNDNESKVDFVEDNNDDEHMYSDNEYDINNRMTENDTSKYAHMYL